MGKKLREGVYLMAFSVIGCFFIIGLIKIVLRVGVPGTVAFILITSPLILIMIDEYDKRKYEKNLRLQYIESIKKRQN